jgi:LemA protein
MNRWWIAAAVLVVVVVFLYNRLVRRRLQVDNAFGSIDAMLKKRHDLIPNLVSAVRVYMRHEEGLLTRVTELRAAASSKDLAPGRRSAVEAELTRALSGLMVAVEAYPELRSNENVLQLQAALNEVEEQISAARRFYNTAATEYNTARRVFPSNLVAAVMRVDAVPVYSAEAEERATPDVGRLAGDA